MTHEDSAETNTSLHALARTCQLVAGDALNWEGWPDFADIARRFADVPDASSYVAAVTAVGLLVQFTKRLGEDVHRRFHGEERKKECSFQAPSPSLAAHVPVKWSGLWNPGRAVQAWLASYETAFTAAHQHDIVERAKRRLRIRRGALTITRLARELGCSVAVLQRRFAEETGETPAAYRQRVRVAAAIELLCSSDAKIETIAREVGWKNKKDLYRALAKLAHLTAAGVRKLSPSDAAALSTRILRCRITRHNPS
jgi:AraC-type DNA-binding domain-containing proteins